MKNFIAFFLSGLLFTWLIIAGWFSGYLPTHGEYTVVAVDTHGNPLGKNLHMTVHGNRIDSARNALCSIRADAVIIITQRYSKEQLSESPWHCR